MAYDRSARNLAQRIADAADADGVLQADQVREIVPARPELHRAIHQCSLAEALGVRAELDAVQS